MGHWIDRCSMGKTKSKKQNIANGVKNGSPVVSPVVVEDKLSSKEDTPLTSGDKTLPIEDALDAWMNDDVGIIDDEDDLSPPVNTKPTKDETNESAKAEEKKKEETKPSSGYKTLPMNDATDAWMMDDDVVMSLDDDEEEDEKIKEEKEEGKLL